MGVKDLRNYQPGCPVLCCFYIFCFYKQRCTNKNQIKFRRQTLYGVSAANVSFDGVMLTRSRSAQAMKTVKRLCLTCHSPIMMMILFIFTVIP